MENSVKAIIIAASVVVTLALVTLGFMLLRSGQELAQNQNNRMTETMNELAESEYTMYDQQVVKGDKVLNALKKFRNEYIAISVKTKMATSETWYINTATVSNDGNGTSTADIVGSTQVPFNVLTDVQQSEYINPNGEFLGQVFRDGNGRIAAIKFIQQ